MRFRFPVLITIAVMLGVGDLYASAQEKKLALSSTTDTVTQRLFFSAALEREMPYEVVLPVGYASGQRRYPVLYLLHGWQGDETNWIKRTRLVQLASSYPLIVVTPRAGNSWYVNSATDPADRYADYIVDDLIADVDNHYRTIAAPPQRAIAGLSMGGYGALLFTFRHPGLFGFTGSISGAFAGPSGIEDVLPELKPSTDQAFGAAGATRKENDLDELIAAADPSKTAYLFLECGTTDPLLPSNRHVVDELSSHKFVYEYHEFPGAHTWSFWDNSIPALLDTLAQQLHLQSELPEARTSISLRR
jgi:S-formylglutathione hydrolase FrmB